MERAGDSSQLAEGDDAEVPVAEFLDDPEWVDGRDDPSEKGAGMMTMTLKISRTSTI
ncbi:hypothetical protein CERSUDRAFT_84327, partial [Gelatoporia subvermispora B]